MNSLDVRPAVKEDAAPFLDLWNALDTETEFMLYEPNERKATLDSQQTMLSNASESDNVHIIVLACNETHLLAGFCAGRRSSNHRDKHVLHVVIGIRQGFTGKQWGRRLLGQLEAWAGSVGIVRLELNVMVNNQRAVSLYKAMGYKVEGTRKQSVALNSGFVDEHVMAKLI